MKISILYVSISGNTEKAAEFIKDGITDLSACDIDVKLMNLANEDALDTDFINESAAVIIGTPTYSGSMAWQLKKWFDTGKASLAGKLGAAFATAKYVQGGPGIAVDSVLQHMLVKGMLVYSSGTGCGLPYVHYGPIAFKSELEKSKDIFVIFGTRIAEKAVELFSR
jgi:NAD(P)H dehydrogenase (quinone)